MRFRTFLFFLPHLATAGFFSDHVQRNLNHEIDPCDDFYDHVCSTTSENSSLYQDEAPKWFLDTVSQLASPKIREFRMQVEDDYHKFPADEMEHEDNETLKQLFADSGLPYMPSLAVFNDYRLLAVIEIHEAHYRLQSTPYYNTLLKKMEDIFAVLKGILNEEFLGAYTDELAYLSDRVLLKVAPWTNRYPKFVEFLKTVELLHVQADKLDLEEETIKIEEKYEACLSITTNKTRSLSVHCLNYAVCPTKLRSLEDKNSFFNYIFEYGQIATSFNAGYDHKKNIVMPFLPLYTLEDDELPFMLGSLDVVLSHEMGHIFFHGKAVPSNSECYRKHIQNTCYSYISNKAECELYDINLDNELAENGNYSRLSDDASDWIGIYAGLKSLAKYYQTVFTEKQQTDDHIMGTELMKKFFYAHAINWCSKKPEQGGTKHSPNKVRVNGVLSMFDEFTEAFQCKRGSKMAKAASCLPFAGIGAPTRKRHRLQ